MEIIYPYFKILLNKPLNPGLLRTAFNPLPSLDFPPRSNASKRWIAPNLVGFGSADGGCGLVSLGFPVLGGTC